ncbi:MAG: phosphoglycerate mutase family protein [Bacteroidetes bacterium]|jgi:broad specificity phosphatase PhoE|nr:phosphoglycerate mutase family protein [Bacteroidota bacterium]MDF1867130.1 phosphoglycerate mutase family protein [Saprospiraceae bacterium]
MSKLYFFRHAQASFGADNYDALSPKGEEQSVELGNYLANKKMLFNKVFVGPLQRQQHTFEIVKNIFDKHNLPMPEPILENGLLEHEGHIAMAQLMPTLLETVPLVKELAEKSKVNPARKKANSLLVFQYFLDEWAEGKINAEGILPWKSFRQEVKKGLDNILKNTDSGETIAAFTSGGTIASITAEALKIVDEKRVVALNFSHRNTAFTSFFYSKGQFNLFGFNEIPHLEKKMVTFV